MILFLYMKIKQWRVKVRMRITHFASRFISTAIFVTMLLVIVFNFNTIFPALSRHSLTLMTTKYNNPIDIPSNLNFLNDDKKDFIEYCKTYYGEKLPLSVDNDAFVYYGSIDGVRLYRLQSNLIPYERVQQSESINGRVFMSDCTYRPSKTGLYIICDQGVFTLDEAYERDIIDIDDVYNLYLDKFSQIQAQINPIRFIQYYN
jgi:hypothetical protein